jgi:hypothetical protein
VRFIIDGTEYEAASLERITGIDALDLVKQAGFGVQTLARRLDEMSRLAYDADGAVIVLPPGADKEDPPRVPDGDAVMDSAPHLGALLAFLWLSRRLTGERRLTLAESSTFTFVSLEIVTDGDEDEDDPDAVDPTRPSASAPVDGADATSLTTSTA